MPNANLFVRLAFAAAVGLAVATHAARAEDIDVYSLPGTESTIPNILFILDNTANWSASINTPLCDDPAANVKVSNPDKEEGTKMGAQKCALYKLIKEMPLDELREFNIGFMLFNESPDSASYPRKAFVNIATQEQKDAVLKMIADLRINGDKGNNAATAEAFYEAWLYFTSSQIRLGNKTATKHDKDAFNGDVYRGPLTSCTKNHIIYLANGSPGDNNNVAFDLLKRLNPTATRTRIPPSEGVSNSDEANWSDEFAAFFNRGVDLNAEYEGTQNISVHTIAVTGASSDGNYPNFIRWIADEGGGIYKEARNSAMLISGLRDMLNQIRSRNSAFSSASLPVSANTQGTYLNQVFIGMFRPDNKALPRWVGNLKQYQFIYDPQGDTLQLADALGNPAVSPATGFISSSAVSFWTRDSSFWAKVAANSGGKYSPSDSPDGELVEKGGVAQWLRTTYPTSSELAKRKVYTCVGDCNLTNPSAALDLTAANNSYRFVSGNATLDPTAFGAGFNAERRDLLVNWVRGEENTTLTNTLNFPVAQDQLGSQPDGQTVRPSIHGDVLHSRPVAINYGASTGVVVYYGSNDGLLRAVAGSQQTGGNELWAFVASDHFGKLNRLRENQDAVKYPSTPSSTPASPRDYFFDGPIGMYQNTIKNEVFIFPTMRRGGRGVYAFDVTTPTQPKLLWRVRPARSGYESLGQTWSMPKVAVVKDREEPVLIMGGGYDAKAEDAETQGTTEVGRGVYVMGLKKGERLAHLMTDHSVPSDVALVDSDGDGKVDRAYVSDIRAQVYRIDMEDASGNALAPDKWTITKIADLSTASTTSKPRKVFFAPDVILTRNYTVLLLGTGDREKPLDLQSNDRFYVLKDKHVAKGTPTAFELIKDAPLPLLGDANATPESLELGCKLPLATDGERVINQPITFGGITYFATNKPLPPNSKSCSSAINRAYQVPLICRAPRILPLEGAGLPPSPVVGYVDVGGRLVPFVIGGGDAKQSSIEVSRANIPIPAKRRRSYWYMNNNDR